MIAATGTASLAERFKRFARYHALPSSPLYSRIAEGISVDPAVLRLAAEAKSRPVTNLLLAAVHWLLLRGVDHPLRNYYQSLCPVPLATESVYPEFHSFCLQFTNELLSILQTRRTQTNEVRRCLYLALGIDLVTREAGELAMIDVGSSAGLHLLWPRYGYNYEGQRLGDSSAPVQLVARFEGELRPLLPDAWAQPRMQVGIDLYPLNVRNSEDCMWLQALIWPEHRERAALLDAALQMARLSPPQVLQGDVFDVLPDLVRTLPRSTAICVCHNHTLNQFLQPDRERFVRLMEELGRERDAYRLSAEWMGEDGVNTRLPQLMLHHYRDGQRSKKLLAFVDDHGKWIQWQD